MQNGRAMFSGENYSMRSYGYVVLPHVRVFSVDREEFRVILRELFDLDENRLYEYYHTCLKVRAGLHADILTTL